MQCVKISCPSCGGAVDSQGDGVMVCAYCDTRMVIKNNEVVVEDDIMDMYKDNDEKASDKGSYLIFVGILLIPFSIFFISFSIQTLVIGILAMIGGVTALCIGLVIKQYL